MPKKKKASSSKRKGKNRASVAPSADGEGSQDAAWMNMLGAPGVDNRQERQQQVSRNENVKVPTHLLLTLRSAIRIRQRVALLYEKGRRDEGHDYFVSVLQYCYQRLKPLAVSDGKPRAAKSCENDGGVSTVSNKFEVLSVDETEEPDEDKDNETESWEEESIQRPEEPDEDYFIIDDLIEGSDCFVATAFLETIDTLLEEVAVAFRNLKHLCRTKSASGEGEKALLSFELMKCGVVANAAIQELRYAEQVFLADRPHLNTIYRIIAAYLFPDCGSNFAAMAFADDESSGVAESVGTPSEGKEEGDSSSEIEAPLVLECTREFEQAIVEYMGDSLWKRFPLTMSNHEAWLAASSEFARDWDINPSCIYRLGASTIGILLLELHPGDQEEIFDHLGIGGRKVKTDGVTTTYDDSTIQPETWFAGMSNLSGDRSIIRTLYHLEQFRRDIDLRKGKPSLRRDVPKGWKRLQPLETVTTTSLEHAFVEPLLVELCDKCQWGSLRKPLAFETTLLPVLRSFREFYSDEQVDQPVSLEFAFIVQMMQLAVIELYGDGDLTRLSLTAKLSLSRYNDGLEKARSRSQDHKRLFETLEPLSFSMLLLKEEEQPLCSPGIDNVAFFNPCLAGMSILYTTIYPNLEVGCPILDLNSKLKAALHLSHAFKERGIPIPSSSLLDFLEENFLQSSSVWAVQPKPKRFNFSKHFLLATGMRLETATKLAHRMTCILDQRPINETVGLIERRSAAVTPEDRALRGRHVSQSYRVLVLSDFSENEGKARSGNEWLVEFRERVSETITHLEEEKGLLSCNLPFLGVDLCGLVDDLAPDDASVGFADDLPRITMLLSFLDGIEMPDDRVELLASRFAAFFSDDVRPIQKYEFLV